MAYNDVELDIEEDKSAKSGAGVSKTFLIVVLVILAIGITVVGTLYLLDGSGDPDAIEYERGPYGKKGAGTSESDRRRAGRSGSFGSKRKPYYLELSRPVVVNLNGSSGIRFLQVSVALMTYEQKNVARLKAHMPVIRHNLVLLFSSQKFADLQTVAGKKKLQQKTLNMIRSEMQKVTGDPLVDAVYLPSLVGQ